MISNYRSSISTLHFKGPLSVALSQSLTNAAAQHQTKVQNPHQRTSRLTTLMADSELSHYPNAHLTHSFCSIVLKLVAKKGFISEAMQLHSHVIKLGYYNLLSLQNQILHAYVKCNGLTDMRRLFDEMPVRNVVSWNTVICGIASCDQSLTSSLNLGFGYFRRMRLEMVRPDSLTLNGLLRVLMKLNDMEIGRQLHAFAVKWGLGLAYFVGNALVDLYGKFGLVEDARRVFDELAMKDLVLWNVMISCYAMNGYTEEALRVFRLIQLEGIGLDEYTFTSLLGSCGKTGCYQLGKQLQGLVIKLSLGLDVHLACTLVDMYAKNQEVNDARKAFDEMPVRNVVSWNAMIVGYGQHGDGEQAMKLLMEMFRNNVCPDELTLASIFSSCSNLSATNAIIQVHAYVAKTGVQAFISVANALITAYSKCGCIESAYQCFNSVQEPDLVTWTSILTAYAFHGQPRESLRTFEAMLLAGVRPDNVSFLGVLSACSHAGLMREGLNYFTLMVTGFHMEPDSEHYACLIDLLGRARLLHEAFGLLASIPVRPSANILGALLGACKVYGNVELAEWAAYKLFELEPENPVNYALLSNMYASFGHWSDVARVRQRMKETCNKKIPGCSCIENGGMVHTFVSSDKSHPSADQVYAVLGMLIRSMAEVNNKFEFQLVNE